jgi:hypothetical protein
VTAQTPQPRLVAAAQAYVGAGWPVAPGAWWDQTLGRYVCTQPNCTRDALHPTLAEATGSATTRCQVSATQAATRDIAAVAARWGRWPYTVLLATGYVADVVEFHESIARPVLAVLAEYEQLGPVATVPDGRVLLFTSVASPADAELVSELVAAGALHHGRGSWVPLPPSRIAAGVVTWSEPPGASEWGLLGLDIIADALRLARPAPVAE